MKINRIDPEELSLSARLLYKEAVKRGIDCKTFSNKHLVRMEYKGKTWYTKGVRSSFQSSVAFSISQNKFLTKELLKEINVPTPQAVVVNDRDDVNLKAIEELTLPLVVKPASNTSHGDGVVMAIESHNMAIQEMYKLLDEYDGVLIEEQLRGDEMRVLCVGGKFLYGRIRKPAFVVGNGTATIEELIFEKNKDPRRGKGYEKDLVLIEIDDDLKEWLLRQGMKLADVPPAGQEVRLRGISNIGKGGEPEFVPSDKIHPDNIKMFELIARHFDIDPVGIDVMAEDFSVPLNKQTCAGVIEINGSPGIGGDDCVLPEEFLRPQVLIINSILKKLGF